MSRASLTVDAATGGLVFESDYDRALVDELKRVVPYQERQWISHRKVWLVAARHGQAVANLAQRYLGVAVRVPAINVVPAEQTKLLEVHYLARCKRREGFDEPMASGADGSTDGRGRHNWPFLFPQSVLEEWFSTGLESAEDAARAATRPKGQKPTLFQILMLKQQPPPTDGEVRSAYLRLAKMWHPDVCTEPDAKARFQEIDAAYKRMMTEADRKRYTAALAFETHAHESAQKAAQIVDPYAGMASTMRHSGMDDGYGYRTAMRQGYMLCTGVQQFGRFTVSKILRWDDIVNQHGQILVSSWPQGGDAWVEQWV